MSTEKQISEALKAFVEIPLVESISINRKLKSFNEDGRMIEVYLTIQYFEPNEA